MIDNDMRTVLLAVKNLNDDKEKWFEALCKNYKELDGDGDEVGKLVEAMRGTGRQSSDIDAFEKALTDLSGRAWETVGKLAEKGRDLPALYTETGKPKSAATAAAAGTLGAKDLLWVTAKQQAYITDTYRQEWRTWLPVQLDQILPDWQRQTPADCARYVDGWLQIPATPAGSSTPATAPAGNGIDLAWLTAEQRAHIQATYREDPQTWLPTALGDKLPKLLQRDEAGRIAWVNKWLQLAPSATAEVPGQATAAAAGASDAAVQPAAEPADPWDFAWVTDGQRAQLETHVTRGPWVEWLPEELTSRLGAGWADLPVAELTARLEDMIGLLDLPAPDLYLEAEQLVDSVAARVADEPDLSDYVATLDPDQLDAIWDKALSRLAQTADQ